MLWRMFIEKGIIMYKEWMLLFQWEVNEELKDETFFFDTKENMINFVKASDNIKIEAAFKLEELDKSIFINDRKDGKCEANTICG